MQVALQTSSSEITSAILLLAAESSENSGKSMISTATEGGGSDQSSGGKIFRFFCQPFAVCMDKDDSIKEITNNSKVVFWRSETVLQA